MREPLKLILLVGSFVCFVFCVWRPEPKVAAAGGALFVASFIF